jgi:hypothetical protein
MQISLTFEIVFFHFTFMLLGYEGIIIFLDEAGAASKWRGLSTLLNNEQCV